MIYKLQAKLWNIQFTGEIPRLQFTKGAPLAGIFNIECWQNSLLSFETTGGSKHHAVFLPARKSMEDFSRWPDPRCCRILLKSSRVFVCVSGRTFCRKDTAVCRFPLSAVSDSQLVRSGDKASERTRRKRCRASEAQVGMRWRYAAGRTLTLLGRRSLSRSPCADAISQHFLPVRRPSITSSANKMRRRQRAVHSSLFEL